MPPPEIVCSHVPEDGSLLSAWLSDRRSAKVHLSVPKKGMKRKLIEMAVENARVLSEQGHADRIDTLLKKMAAVLHLSDIPEDIGAFDISNISGGDAVGSFVHWAGGAFVRDNYRHIKMEALKGPDDYAMIKEMVKRTFRDAKSNIRGPEIKNVVHPPDLIIIDGGKGQLRSANQALDTLGISVDVISIAKAPDRAFMLQNRAPVNLEDGTDVSLLLRKIRDEAHRFALTYHKKIRSRKIFASPLEKIPGIGKKRRFALLKHFGSIEAVKCSSVEEIAQLRVLNRPLAEKILESLKGRDDGQA
jgi:excinuclease ABC subunit C